MSLKAQLRVTVAQREHHPATNDALSVYFFGLQNRELKLPFACLIFAEWNQITTTLPCGWVGSKASFYQLCSPKQQIANYISSPFASLISQE